MHHLPQAASNLVTWLCRVMPEEKLCLVNQEIRTRQSLWEPVTRQSLVTRILLGRYSKAIHAQQDLYF